VAKCLGEHGGNVVVNYINDAKAADDVVQSIRSQGKGGAIAVKADASTVEGGQLLLQEAVKTFGKVDILVCVCVGSRTPRCVVVTMMRHDRERTTWRPTGLGGDGAPSQPGKVR
jgi:NAD(P)-dependent dehydrogenase (short-subunit alcohol dehydrogenase family)